MTEETAAKELPAAVPAALPASPPLHEEGGGKKAAVVKGDSGKKAGVSGAKGKRASSPPKRPDPLAPK